MDYKDQLRTPEWRYVRSRILERDKWRCALCDTTLNLQVHHMYYTDGKMAWEYPDSALLTLCDACHKREHDKHKSERIQPSRLDEALERLVIVAQGVRQWCQRQLPEDEKNG